MSKFSFHLDIDLVKVWAMSGQCIMWVCKVQRHLHLGPRGFPVPTSEKPPFRTFHAFLRQITSLMPFRLPPFTRAVIKALSLHGILSYRKISSLITAKDLPFPAFGQKYNLRQICMNTPPKEAMLRKTICMFGQHCSRRGEGSSV